MTVISCVLNLGYLFSRCVLNWFGDWSTGALYQVGKEFTNKIDLEKGQVSLHKINICIQLLKECLKQ